MKLHLFGAANLRISNIEPQKAEVWNRFAQPFLNRQNTLLRYSAFIVQYSIFAFSKFLSRFDGTLAARGDAYIILRCSSIKARLSWRPKTYFCLISNKFPSKSLIKVRTWSPLGMRLTSTAMPRHPSINPARSSTSRHRC